MSRRRWRRRNLLASCIRFAEKNGMTCMSTTTAPAGYLDSSAPLLGIRRGNAGVLESFFSRFGNSVASSDRHSSTNRKKRASGGSGSVPLLFSLFVPFSDQVVRCCRGGPNTGSEGDPSKFLFLFQRGEVRGGSVTASARPYRTPSDLFCLSLIPHSTTGRTPRGP